MPAVGPHAERIGAEVLGGDVGCPLPPGDDAGHQVRAHVAAHDDGCARPGQPHDPGEAERVGAVPQACACDRNAAPADLVEERAAAVERDDAHVKALFVQAGDKARPLPLGAARLEVGAHEHDPRRALAGHPATGPESTRR